MKEKQITEVLSKVSKQLENGTITNSEIISYLLRNVNNHTLEDLQNNNVVDVVWGAI